MLLHATLFKVWYKLEKKKNLRRLGRENLGMKNWLFLIVDALLVAGDKQYYLQYMNLNCLKEYIHTVDVFRAFQRVL